MDPRLYSYIRKNYRKPLPELKLELMKKGLSSYQIENALDEVRAEKRKTFIRHFVILLVVIIIIAIIGLVFISFIKPAEKFVVQTEEKQITLDLPSEKPVTSPFVEDKVPDIAKDIVKPIDQIKKTVEKKTVLPSEITKSLEEIKEISNTRPSDALEHCSALEQKDFCISMIAKNINRPIFCDTIEDQSIKDDCFFFFGQSDKQYCEQIYSGILRDSCEQLAEIQERI